MPLDSLRPCRPWQEPGHGSIQTREWTARIPLSARSAPPNARMQRAGRPPGSGSRHSRPGERDRKGVGFPTRQGGPLCLCTSHHGCIFSYLYASEGHRLPRAALRTPGPSDGPCATETPPADGRPPPRPDRPSSTRSPTLSSAPTPHPGPHPEAHPGPYPGTGQRGVGQRKAPPKALPAGGRGPRARFGASAHRPFPSRLGRPVSTRRRSPLDRSRP